MCKIMICEWNELSSTHAHEMLKGDFPSCGIKYTSKFGAGLVVIKGAVSRSLLNEKARAAGIKHNISYVFKAPKNIADVYDRIPTLSEAV